MARGHQVDIVTSNADGAAELDYPVGRFVAYRGANTIFFPRKYGEAFKFSPGMAKWLCHHVRDYEIVHIHAVFSWSSLAAANACYGAEIPYLVRPLGSLDPWSMSQKPLRKKVMLQLGVKKMLRNAARIHYTSDLEKQASEDYLGLGNGVVVANAIDCEQFEDSLTAREFSREFPQLADRRYLLFIGRLDPKKKLETVIDAFSRLQNQADMQLVIAGEGTQDYRQKLVTRVLNSGASDRISLVPWVQGKTKTALLQNCLLFLLVSENENYGISVAEALACGKPVIVNKGVYLHPEISAAAAGWVIDQDSDLVDCLERVLDSPENCMERGRNGARLIQQRFRWESITQRLEEIYRDCMEN